MASDAQETLYRIFAALSGGAGSGASGGSLATTAAGEAAGAGAGATTAAVAAAAAATAGSKPAAESGGSGADRVALNVVKNGLGVVPLVAALFGLFGGGDDEKPAPLVKYALPARREFQAAITDRGFASADYDQWGMARAERQTPRPSGGGISPPAQSGTAGSTQILVNVQAMDARSFLDRSGEIAAAVREAMLNLNSINDVVQDL